MATTKSEIAIELGTSPSSVSTMLRELRQELVDLQEGAPPAVENANRSDSAPGRKYPHKLSATSTPRSRRW